MMKVVDVLPSDLFVALLQSFQQQRCVEYQDAESQRELKDPSFMYERRSPTRAAEETNSRMPCQGFCFQSPITLWEHSLPPSLQITKNDYFHFGQRVCSL